MCGRLPPDATPRSKVPAGHPSTVGADKERDHIRPSTAGINGGTRITITGANLEGATSVVFADTAAVAALIGDAISGR
jgi:hypothetical protein